MEKAPDSANSGLPASPAQPSGRRRKKFLLLLLIPAGLILLGALLILGMPNRWQVDPKMSKADSVRLHQLTTRLTTAMVTPEGKLTEKAEIELTEPELNTILRTGLRMAQLRRTPGLFYDAEWRNGGLRLRVSRILPLFAVNLETDLVPEFARGRAVLRTRSCRLGRLPLLSAGVDAALRGFLARYENTPEWQAASMLVESVEVTRTGTVRIIFYPGKINQASSVLLNAVWGR